MKATAAVSASFHGVLVKFCSDKGIIQIKRRNNYWPWCGSPELAMCSPPQLSIFAAEAEQQGALEAR